MLWVMKCVKSLSQVYYQETVQNHKLRRRKDNEKPYS